MLSIDKPLLLQGGTVIDGRGGPPFRADVAIVGDRIAGVGETFGEGVGEGGSEGVGGPDWQVIDVAGCTVMPGLIDAHCHVTFGEPSSNDELFFHREQSQAMLLAAFNVPKLLRAGVTGFLDADCLFNLGPALRDAINAGMVEGPRMASGMNALLTAAGGTAGRLIPDAGTLGYAQVVRNRDEMVQVVRQQVKYGADWIKVHVTGSVPNRVGELAVWNLDELKAITDTAHALEVPTVAHCRNAHSTLLAAQAGVDLILHASFLDEPALQAVIDAGSAIAPTFTFLANLADYGAKVGAATSQVDVFRGEIAATAEMLRVAYREGVKLLCGSESGFSLTPYGHWHAREMELFVRELDLTPLEAISCATRNGALALRRDFDSIGVVAVDASADVIVIDGDPTADIAILGDRTKLRHVISRGREVDLHRPWPQRSALPGETVGRWSTQLLTREVVHP